MKRSIIYFALVFIVALTSAGRDRLFIEDFNILAGETLQVPVILLNDTAYCGFQTDLYLPEGLSLDVEDDEYIIDLTSRKTSSHNVASRLLSDGAIRIYVSSINAREFSGNNGAIMILTLTAADDFTGQAVIELKNSICAETIGTRHVLDNEICLVNPGQIPAIRGDVDRNGKVSIDDVTELISILLSGQAASAVDYADVDENGKVSIDDVTTLISYLLSGSWPLPEINDQTFTVNGVTFTMVGIEGGTFTMGATPEQGDDALDGEKPAHQVTLSSYAIGQTEVTQALWVAVMGSNPSRFSGRLENPVEGVTWNDCQEFITQLNALTGKNFRLPTEAEWEFAARGGNKSQGYKYAGSNDINEVAWYTDNSTSTQPVATKKANELGLYDMSGNVWEWCQDYYGDYSSEPQTNPTGPETGTTRIRRGVGWNGSQLNGRVSHRSSREETYKYNSLGLRLAL